MANDDDTNTPWSLWRPSPTVPVTDKSSGTDEELTVQRVGEATDAVPGRNWSLFSRN